MIKTCSDNCNSPATLKEGNQVFCAKHYIQRFMRTDAKPLMTYRERMEAEKRAA